MYKYKPAQYHKDICFKCLQVKESIVAYNINKKGYEDGRLDGVDTKLQLCHECDNGLNIEDNEEILNIVDSLPIQGQELFYNTCNKTRRWNYKPTTWIEQTLHEDINLECTHAYELIKDGIIIKHCWFEDNEQCKNCKSFKHRDEDDKVVRLTTTKPIWLNTKESE